MSNPPITTKEQSLPKEESGNTFLGLGALSGVYGIFTKISAGYFCPACLILTPLLLSIGLWKKRLTRSHSKQQSGNKA